MPQPAPWWKEISAAAPAWSAMSSKAASTIYFEKKYNLPMRQPNPEIFAEFVRDTSKPLPDSYQRLKRRNLGLAVDEEKASV